MNYKKLGLGVYAFSDDARKTVDELVTHETEAENLLYWVESESMVLIRGPEKSGKTRLALEVIENFKGEGKVIYIDLDTYNKEVDVGHLLIGSQSFFRKLANKMPKDMILIVDNAHSLDTDFYRRLQYFFDQSYLKSVVLIERANSELELPDSIKSRIGNKIINLNELSKDECVEIVKTRLNGFLDEKQLEQVWTKSDNLSNFLINCEMIVSKYLEEERKKIDNNFIEKVLTK